MFRSKILQVRLEHAKEKVDIIGRLRDFKNAFVTLFVRPGGSMLWRIGKGDLQGQFFCDQINRSQPNREMLEKTSEHKNQRLGGFDLVFKLEVFLEQFRRPNQFENSIASAVGALPHSNCFRAESRAELLFIQRCQLAKCLDSPLAQDHQDLLHVHLPFHEPKLQQIRVYVQVNSSDLSGTAT